MFLVGQLPLTDVRPFLATPTHRLPVPDWPLVEPGAEFVRSFGVVRRRRGGGVAAWAGEEVYCEAAHALRLPNRLGESWLGPPEVGFRPHCLFRRFFALGPVGRVDVGFEHKRSAPPLTDLDGGQVAALLDAFLSLPVRVPGADDEDEPRPLHDAGAPLARHYLRATTEWSDGRPRELQEWWCAAGTPLLLVDYRRREVRSLPPHARRVRSLDEQGIELHHCTVERRGRTVGVWLLGHADGAAVDTLRRLRIHLFRLHAEREGLRQVLRAVGRRRRELDLEPHTDAFDALQDYLNRAIGLLERERAYGFEQSGLLEAAWESGNLVSPGERASLLAALEKARRNIVRKVERVTAERPERARIVNVFQQPRNVHLREEIIEEQTVIEEQSMVKIHFGDHATIHGDFTVATAEKIENSFNKAAAADAPGELKAKLEELARAVAEMTRELPPEKAEEAARDLETLTEEATSENPRRRWYELSAEGLVEAAKAVGESAGPVIKTVKAILALLA
jgi:hypothetical protein